MARACDVIVRARLAGVRERLQRALDDCGDVEAIHQLRVSSRRCFAALDVLSGWLPEKPRQKLAKRLRRLRRRCGKARDADVQDRFLEHLAGEPGRDAIQIAGLSELRDRLSRRRHKTRRRLRRKLPKLADRIRRAGRKLISATTVADSANPSNVDPTPLAIVARRILAAEMEAIRVQPTVETDPPEKLHPLRIACKRLRYVLEIFIPVLPSEWQSDVYPRLQKLQELLGEIQDGIVGQRSFSGETTWCETMCDDRSDDAAKMPDTAGVAVSQAVALVQEEYAARVAQAHATFRSHWRCFCESLPAL